MIKSLPFSLFLLACSLCSGQLRRPDSIARQMRYAAREELLDIYYPRVVDTLYGGYLSSFDFAFQPQGNQEKMIVTQARHTWTTAKAYLFYHDSSYLALSRHGFAFLRDKMWDREFGGFYNLVTRQGVPVTTQKQAYGNAFGMYAAAAYFGCSGDSSALDLARAVFLWLEKHSHDPVYKGYYQYLERDGTPVRRSPGTSSLLDIGYKDQNSSIHLLEALTELYQVWPDPLVKARLQEMLLLIRGTIITPMGTLQLFFTPDWKPVSFRDSSRESVLLHHNLDHVSFGHDVETAYLMLEASEALGIKGDTLTRSVGKKMVDHALANGWDSLLGGFYDEGYYFKDKPGITITAKTKNWWAQAEGLNTLLLLSDAYPGDRMHYYDHFVKLWDYVQTYLIDHQHGDWYEGGLDQDPSRKTSLKAHIWKAAYHNFRSLRNCILRLEAAK